MKRRVLFSALAVGLALASAGCNLLPEPQADRTRHYVLESAVVTPAPAGAVRLGLRRVEVPSYLKSKAMVSRVGNNELRYAESARWAEPFEAGVGRVLRDQLGAGAVVSAYPFSAGMERDLDLVVRVVAAEGRDEGVQFTATYEVSRPADGTIVVRRTYTAPVLPWRGDYGEMSVRLSEAVAALAADIVAGLPPK